MPLDRSIMIEGGPVGVLLIHGLGGTPVELREVARRLAATGATVLCCQLAGHCGTEAELAATTIEDWYASAAAALATLEARCTKVIVGGLSMGALLAALLAARNPESVDGVVMLAPTLRYDGWSIPRYGFLLRLLINTPLGRRYRFVEREPYGLKDERIRSVIVRAMRLGDTDAGSLGTPSAALRQLWRLVGVLKPQLGSIRQPVFIAHARHDDVASFNNAVLLQRRLGGTVDCLVLDDSYHLVTLDRQRHLVTDRISAFIQGVVEAPLRQPASEPRRATAGRAERQAPTHRPPTHSLLRDRWRMSHDALVGDWPGETARAPVAPLVRMVSGMAGIDATAWKAARPPESEGWAYLAACETSPPAALELAAVSVGDRSGLAAAAPLFALKYRLDTPLQDGPLAAFCDRLARRAPGLLEWRMLGVGSTFTDACPVALNPRLCEAGRAEAVAGLIAAVEAEAARRGTGLVVFKDLAPRELALLAPHLAAARYFAVESLPVAVLDLDGTGDLDGYLARLSPATRKDLRRKMKRAERVEVEWRTSLAGMEGEVRALYEATRTRSQVRYGDFEDLPDGYFETVSRALGTDAVFACYRVGGQLAAFNLLFVEPDRVIDKFLGMAYPLGPAHDLYALSWLENVRFCQRIGRRHLQTGQTAYASKLRFGSALEPRTHLVKHRNRALHAVLRLAAPLLAFPRWDPDLRRLGREGAR